MDLFPVGTNIVAAYSHPFVGHGLAVAGRVFVPFGEVYDLVESQVRAPFRYLDRSNAKVVAFAPMVQSLVMMGDLDL